MYIYTSRYKDNEISSFWKVNLFYCTYSIVSKELKEKDTLNYLNN